MRKRIISILVIILLITNVMISPLTKNVHAASTPISLGFNPYDSAIDPTKSNVYMTKPGSKTIYSVNYETGDIKTLELPYIAEKLEVYNNKLYVTQMKMNHNHYNFGPYSGAIAEIDTESFTLLGLMNINADPFDIAIDKDGYIYVTPGSGQWEDLKVYSLIDKTEVVNSIREIYERSYIYYNSKFNKAYTIDSTISPRDVEAFELDKGIIKSTYDSPYHGDYDLEPFAKISPDGQTMYNNSGIVFGLEAGQAGDMQFKFDLGDEYNDYEFSLSDQLTFAASVYGGIDVYKYNTDEYLYSIKENLDIKRMHFNNGIIAIYADETGKYFIDYFKNYGPLSLGIAEGLYVPADNTVNNFYDGIKNIPSSSTFVLRMTQNIKLEDKSKITLQGPNGLVNLNIESEYDVLYIEPEYLYENTNYTLTIDSSAISGYLGEKLSTPKIINFKTKTPDFTSLTVTKNTQNAPLEFVFTANAFGGFEPQYKFLINENGSWRVLQDYSSNRNIIWHPTRPGTFNFRVMVKSNGSDAAYEKTYDFSQVVTDSVLPTATVSVSNSGPTNKDVNISVNAYDNVGIKYIKLPNGTIVNNSSANYSVSTNGTYLFEVEDLLGNVITQVATIENIDKELPQVTLIASTTEATKNDILVVANATDNVNVKSITLPNGTIVNGISATFPISKNGTYTFTVLDTAGNSVTKSITISNIYKYPPAMPIVNEVWNTHTVVSGRTIANSTVTAYVNNKVIGSVKSTARGYFYINIPKQTSGTKISVIVTDPAGSKSSARVVTVLDKIAPLVPIMNSVSSKTTTITGKTEKYATVYVYNSGTYLGKGTADVYGNYKVYIKPQPKGATIKYYAMDRANNKSPYGSKRVY